MKLKTGTMTIKLSGPAGCGKTYTLRKLEEMFKQDGLTVEVCDDYLSRDKYSVKQRKRAEESGADVVIISGENVS